MPKFKKRADGRYATHVTIGRDDNGKLKRKTIYARTIRELESKLAEIKSLQNKGIIVDDKSLTLNEWADEWLKLYKRTQSHNTYTMYENAINTHINPTLGEIRLSALKKHMLQELLNDIISEGKHRTAEIVRMTLRQLINSAIDENYIYVDIANKLTLPKKIKKEKRALTDEEIKTLKDADLSDAERTLIGVMLYAGLRRGEALALSTGDLDLKANLIHIHQAVIFNGNDAEIKLMPKSDAGIRTIPIPKRLKEILTEYIRNCIGSQYIFSNEGKLYSKSTLRRLWERILQKAELDSDVTPHILRHTYATKLFYGGIDIKEAQRLLGHKSVQLTLDIYTHLQTETDELKKRLDNVFDVGEKKAK